MAIQSDREEMQLALDFDAKLVESAMVSVKAQAFTVIQFVPRSRQAVGSTDQEGVLSRLLHEAKRLTW
jgi:hypothetical protein